MSSTVCAKSFGAKHSKTLVGAESDNPILNRGVKAWPTTSGVKLAFTAKQWFITHDASIGSITSFIPIDAGKGSLCVGILGASILLVSQSITQGIFTFILVFTIFHALNVVENIVFKKFCENTCIEHVFAITLLLLRKEMSHPPSRFLM